MGITAAVALISLILAAPWLTGPHLVDREGSLPSTSDLDEANRSIQDQAPPSGSGFESGIQEPSRVAQADVISVVLTGDVDSADVSGSVSLVPLAVENRTAPSLSSFDISEPQFSIPVPEGTRNALLVARFPGFYVEHRLIELSGANHSIEIPLWRAAPIFCSVIAPNGDRIGSATVRCTVSNEEGRELDDLEQVARAATAVEQVTDALGNATFLSYSAEPVCLVVTPPSNYAKAIAWDCFPGEHVTIVCREKLGLRGRVRDPSGAPISGVNIAAYGPLPRGGEMPLSSTQSREDGHFTLEDVPDGILYIRCFAEREGWSMGERLLRYGDPERDGVIEFILSPALGGELVLTTGDGSPVANFRIRIVGEGDYCVPFTYMTDPMGLVSLNRYLVPGVEYQIQAILGGIQAPIGRFIWPIDRTISTNPFAVVAQSLGKLRLSPDDVERLPAIELERKVPGGTEIAFIDIVGTDLLLPAGDYSLSARVGDHVFETSFHLSPGAEERLLIDLTTLDVELVVNPARSGDFPSVAAYSLANVLCFEGQLSAPNQTLKLAAGSYYFSLTYPDNSVDSLPYRLTHDQQVVDLRGLLESEQGIVHGAVRTMEGLPVSGISVRVEAQDGYRLPALVTDAQGEFRSLPAPRGAYWVSADISPVTGVAGDIVRESTVLGASVAEDAEVLFSVPEQWVEIDFSELPGRPERGYLLSGSEGMALTLGPRSQLRAPIGRVGSWAVVPSWDERSGFVVGAVRIDAANGDYCYRESADPTALAAIRKKAASHCQQDVVRLLVANQQTGLARKLEGANEIQLRWTVGVSLGVEVKHECGLVEMIYLADGDLAVTDCDGEESLVHFSRGEGLSRSTFEVTSACCGIRLAKEVGEVLSLRCNRPNHDLHLGGPGVFPHSVSVRSGSHVNVLAKSEPVRIESVHMWDSMYLQLLDGAGQRFELSIVEPKVWECRQLPVGNYSIMARRQAEEYVSVGKVRSAASARTVVAVE